MHARFYNPQLGRFLSFDPGDSARRAEPLTWNRYAYALNNPVNMVDPDGRDALRVGNEILIPVKFDGPGATPENIAAIERRVNELQIVGATDLSIKIISVQEPVDGVMNTMTLGNGPNNQLCGAAGECVNRLGGDTGYINMENAESNSAAAHGSLHFAGIEDQYAEGPRDQDGNRTSTAAPGYDNNNIMTSRTGTELKAEQLEEAAENDTTKVVEKREVP